MSLSNIPKEQQYSMKLKGLSICFNMLKAALCGNYVNFGVIRLYGDRALDDSLEIFVKTLMSIQQSEVLVSGLILGCGDLKSSHINLSPLFCNMQSDRFGFTGFGLYPVDSYGHILCQLQTAFIRWCPIFL